MVVQMEVNKNLVNTAKYQIKCPFEMVPECIVVHNTANDATAANEIHYMINNDNKVSFHYAVDDKMIVQGVPENRNAWHAGDGALGKGNRTGIGVEICYSKSGGQRFIDAEKLAAKFIAFKLKEYKWTVDRVKKHKDFSGKYCPHRTLDLGWDRFVDMIKVELDKLTPTGTPIMGLAECDAAQLELYLLANNKEPKINMDVKAFCKLWISEGAIESVRGDIAFAQACHETGFFKYGGQVLPEQNNYGGIGATNNSATGKGAWFESPAVGVRASIQHLKAYASKEPLKQACVDPRYHLVTKGIAPTFEELGGRWAVPGFDKAKYKTLEEAKAAKVSYGDAIIKKFNLLKLMIVPTMPDVSDWAMEGYEWAVDNCISDGSRPKDNVTREELWNMMYRAYMLNK